MIVSGRIQDGVKPFASVVLLKGGNNTVHIQYTYSGVLSETQIMLFMSLVLSIH